MAAGTVSYSDTTGNRDYLGMIASQIGRRLKEASDMASDERAFAEEKAEAGGTSLSEAGIGRGYFFKRALGSRFGGDKIARTKGRMGFGGAGTNPAGDFKSRFRGGFDYNVTNEISAATLPLASALVGGLRGVEKGLSDISSALTRVGVGMGDLARAQEDVARQAILNGAFMQAFLNHMQREAARQRARSEERGLEGGLLTGSGGGGSLGGRGMINVTPPSKSPKRFSKGNIGDLIPAGSSQLSRLGGTTAKAGQKSVRTAVRGVTTGVARPILKGANTVFEGGRKIKKFLPSATRIAKQSSKMLGIPYSASKNFFSQAVMKSKMTPGYINFLNDAINDRYAGLTGMFGDSIDLPKGFKGGFDDLSKVNQENLFTKALTSANAEDDLTELLLKSGYSGTFAGVDSAMPVGRTITKKFSQKAAESITPNRIASLDNAGFKTAEIASDQLVRKGLQKGLTRGSGLARTMVKTFGKSTTRSILKKIPILAGIAGTIFAIQRALEGDFLGAGLELTSGFLGATGIGGLGPGLAIDGFLLARDFGMVPMADGGITRGPLNALIGEAGKEGVFPLEGARGKKTFKMFGQGVVDAREENESGETRLLALGQKRYFESMDGWGGFAKAIVESFTNFRDKVGDIISDANPFNQENLANINNSKASNAIRNVIGSEKDDGFIGPKWLGIKNPFADEQANALNNNSAQMTNGGMGVTTTVINNYNGAIVGDGSGDSGSGSSSLDAYAAFTQQFSLSSK